MNDKLKKTHEFNNNVSMIFLIVLQKVFLAEEIMKIKIMKTSLKNQVVTKMNLTYSQHE